MKYILIIVYNLITFSVAFGLAYLLLYLPTKWIFNIDKLKKARLSISTFIAVMIVVFYIFQRDTNNKTATIENYKDQYVLTVTGKRTCMPNTLYQVFIPSTYIDTFKLILPRAEGIINGQEIPRERGWYKLLGTMCIVNKQIRIDLFIDNYDEHTKEPLTWNGDYKLKWKGNE